MSKAYDTFFRARGWPSWWPAAIAAICTAPFALFCLALTISGSVAFDWRIYVTAAERAWSGGDLYRWSDSYGYIYSPLFAYGFAGVAWIGADAWRAAHLAAALALPTWPMRLITLGSWPFWSDVQNGNVLVFVLLAAAWGLMGSRAAALTYLGMSLLMPRPLMVPVAAWLLFKRPDLRNPFVAMAGVSILGVIATGYFTPWVIKLLESSNIVESTANFGLSRVLGQWALLIGLPVGVWLTLRGRLGWASLVVSPYLLSQYFLMGLLECMPKAPVASGIPPNATKRAKAPRYRWLPSISRRAARGAWERGDEEGPRSV